MRKMAKLTALRLADKKKADEDKNKRGRSVAVSNANSAKSTSTYAQKPSLNGHTRNDQSLRLPKLINNSNKNIEGLKKPNEGIFRITTNSKESKR